ncbi:MAG: class I SAM-dependent methyltransferase [SAR324 cluster bacterium]|nr:class I SAM-dependent methyltransferase [SAR324 cluster bacterium]
MKLEEYEKMFHAEDEHWWFVSKRKFVGAFLSGMLPLSSKVLDVGCGTGAMSVFLKQYGNVTSMDFLSLALSFCKQRNLSQICQGNALELPFRDESFDLVTACDVLYHQWITEDSLALREFHRILKPRGKVLITDSAFSFLSGKHDQFVLARERYTINQMQTRLEQAGFRICKKSYAFFFTFPLVLMIRYLERFRNKEQTDVNNQASFINPLLIKLVTVEARLLKYIRFPWGSSILFLAEKQ